MECMRPVFRDLAHPDLLKKCLHGHTQNSNESFNNVIWSRVPKSTFVQIELLSFGVYGAVACFNVRNVARMRVFKKNDQYYLDKHGNHYETPRPRAVAVRKIRP